MGEREALQAMGRSSTMGPDAVAAATVILVRPDASVLMLKRDSKLAFAGGLWVFPGGRVDPGDYDGSGSLEVAERRAAVREAMEEAGLVIDPDALLRFSHWTPPPQAQKRFSTAFFVASAPDGAVVIDDGEIRDSQWVTPLAALEAQRSGEIELAPPTFITLTYLSRHESAASLLDSMATHVPESFATQVAEVDGQVCALYHGDVGYGPDGDPLADGPRHRLWLDPAGWRYVRTE
ncbi:MAG: NUDIX hydrolase [Microthrixaceae bacterium]|nr:NUDIX hydrolase [Microthrixaceae bacterium]